MAYQMCWGKEGEPRQAHDRLFMEITIKRNLNQTNMIISGPEEIDSHDDALQLILHHQIPGLIPMETESINGQLRLIYDISSRTSLSESMERGGFTRDHLQSLVSSIGNCMETLREYLLDPKHLMLRLDCIFTQAKKSGYEFCYHPFYPNEQQEDLQGLFERIIACIDYEDQELVTMAYEMYMAVQGENLSWKELEDILHHGEASCEVEFRDFFEDWKPKDQMPSMEGADAGDSGFQGDTAFPPIRNWKESPPDPFSHVPQSREDARPASFRLPEEGDSTDTFLDKCRRYLKGKGIREVLGDINDGMLLQKIHMEASAGESSGKGQRMTGSEQKNREAPAISQELRRRQSFKTDPRRLTSARRLVSTDVSDPEVIELKRLPFQIGKLDGSSDYLLDHATVSRHHACIYQDPDDPERYLIEDQRSRNGTYVNGVRLEPFVRTKIRAGDRIRLADQEFVLT